MEIEDLSNTLGRPGSPHRHRLDIGRLAVQRGSFTVITGPSGAGKSHLLSILGLLRRPKQVAKFLHHERDPRSGKTRTHDIAQLWTGRPSRGLAIWREGTHWRSQAPRVFFRGKRIESLRRRLLGFAIQQGELLPALTVFENTELPLRLNRVRPFMAGQRVEALLAELEIPPEVAASRVNRISGGQYQRVAIARALAHEPNLLLVDEPTANLDMQTAVRAVKLLTRLRTNRTTIVMVTHDRRLVEMFATHIIRLECKSLDRYLDRATITGVEEHEPT